MSPSPRLLPLGLVLGPALAACQTHQFHATDLDQLDTGPLPATVTVTALEPESGPAAGGTTVRITGSGYAETSAASVGGRACTSLTFLSDTELVCITPAGDVGASDLLVQTGEASATATFTYLAGDTDTAGDTDSGDTDTGGDTDTAGDTDSGDTDSGDTGSGDTGTAIAVDYCHIQYPCAITVAAGAESDVVYGWVYQAAVTPGAGQGPGVRLQVGVGEDGTDPATGAWSWTEMTYNTDKDGLSAGDLSNDEYGGAFTAPAAPGAYDYAVRASADDGYSWLYCDDGGDTCGGLGSDDGYSAAEAGECTVD